MNAAETQPLLSIIVPSFRMAAYLPEMLDSTLGQSYRPLEVIVVDGGSDDGTVDVLKEYAASSPLLRWISEADDGPADAVNKGLAMARGEFAAIQNADDLYRPGALSAAVSALQSNPEASLVYGDVESIDAQGQLRYARHFPAFSWPAFFANSCTLAQGSVVFRLSPALAVGGWNAQYYSCDLDFWLKLAFSGMPFHVPQVLSAWRRHPQQRTRKEQYGAIRDGYRRMINDSPDLRDAPLRLRRLARASCYLLTLRFPASDSLWLRRLHALYGLALFPTAWRYLPKKHFLRLIPHWRRIRQLRIVTGSRDAR